MSDEESNSGKSIEDLFASLVASSSSKTLLSVEETKRELGIGHTLLYSEIGKGELGSIKIGRRRMFTPEHLKDYVKLKVAQAV